jgi:murein DD-endopeptidase MepM/ murein hydrolase activator NlpD
MTGQVRVLSIYPLYYKGMPYTAGIDGHKMLMPGMKDPWMYDNPKLAAGELQGQGFLNKTSQGDDVVPIAFDGDIDSELNTLVITYGRTKEEAVASGGGQIRLPGTGTEENESGSPSEILDTRLPRYLRWPTMTKKASEAYEWRMDNNGKKKHLQGLDIAGNQGDPVFCSGSGTVTYIATDSSPGGLGNYVVVTHPGGTQTLYGNLDQVLVSPGQIIDCRAGRTDILIGTIGTSGQEDPHLHFNIILSGSMPKGTSIFHYLE